MYVTVIKYPVKSEGSVGVWLCLLVLILLHLLSLCVCVCVLALTKQQNSPRLYVSALLSNVCSHRKQRKFYTEHKSINSSRGPRGKHLIPVSLMWSKANNVAFTPLRPHSHFSVQLHFSSLPQRNEKKHKHLPDWPDQLINSSLYLHHWLENKSRDTATCVIERLQGGPSQT